MNRLFFLISSCALLFIFSSCERGRPVRKTLPDYVIQSVEFEDARESYKFDFDAIPFCISDTNLFVSGYNKKMFKLFIYDPKYDSLVWSISKNFKSLEETVAGIIREENKSGLVVDLRDTYNATTFRKDFTVEFLDTKEHSQYSLVILWDIKSEYRANKFMNEALSLDGIRFIGLEINSKGYFDCFENKSVTLQ